MEISRNFYLEQIREREKNGFVKVITGVRRSGKSYLLFKIFKRDLIDRGVLENHIISIALDNIENKWLREPLVLYKNIKEQIKDDGQYYVMLDEIQLVPDFSEVLNSLLQIENLDVYATGSNSKFLSSDILTEFRGRGDEIRVYPLSFEEYVSAFDGTQDEAFNEYMTYGGLPQILSFNTDERKAKYLTDLFKETYLKDLIEHNGIANTEELEDLVNILALTIFRMLFLWILQTAMT